MAVSPAGANNAGNAQALQNNQQNQNVQPNQPNRVAGPQEAITLRNVRMGPATSNPFVAIGRAIAAIFRTPTVTLTPIPGNGQVGGGGAAAAGNQNNGNAGNANASQNLTTAGDLAMDNATFARPDSFVADDESVASDGTVNVPDAPEFHSRIIRVPENFDLELEGLEAAADEGNTEAPNTNRPVSVLAGRTTGQATAADRMATLLNAGQTAGTNGATAANTTNVAPQVTTETDEDVAMLDAIVAANTPNVADVEEVDEDVAMLAELMANGMPDQGIDIDAEIEAAPGPRDTRTPSVLR